MKLHLIGHDYKYAVEQIMLALFPAEKPDYSSDSDIGSCDLVSESRLYIGGVYASAVTLIRCGDKISRGVARVSRAKLTGKLISDRLLQRIIKQSFYRASLRFVDAPPVWGSLTGIRPAHLAAAAIESGLSGKAAAKKLSGEYYVSRERAGMTVDAATSSIALKRGLEERDIALYVGIPFCPTRCAYCSFVSNSVEKSFGLIEPFMQALLGEIAATSKLVSELGLRIISVYIGGGTPTALPADALETLMRALDSAFDLSYAREYTVEAGRPDTITARKLGIIGRFGADRICVNPQSMSPGVLNSIGRKHTPEDVAEAVRLVRQSSAAQRDGATQRDGAALRGNPASGLALNMDIIAGLPGDSPEGFAGTLDTVLGFEPENITVHTLSLKNGSRIKLENTAIPDGADVGRMLAYAARRLRENGFLPYYLYRQKFTSGGYENTGWSRPGYECVYNICMMEELCTVLALGGGGVTKLVSADGRIRRVFNAKYPGEYIQNTAKTFAKVNAIKEFYVGAPTP